MSVKIAGLMTMFICNQLHLRLDMASPGRYVWTEAGNGPASSNEMSSVHITALTWFRCGVLSLRVILAKRAATGWRSAVLTRDVSPVWARALRAIRADPDVMLHAAKVSVWARWFVWLVGVVELAYRPGFWYAHNKSYLLLGVPLVAFNGFLHYRLRSNPTVTWRCLLFLSAMDIALITSRRHHRRRVPPLQLRGLLPRPGAVRRRVHVATAQPRVDYPGCRRLCDGGTTGHKLARRAQPFLEMEKPLESSSGYTTKRGSSITSGTGLCTGRRRRLPETFSTRSLRQAGI